MTTQTINVYCDESCHLEKDRCKVMVLGSLWCPRDKAREVADNVRKIKNLHGLPSKFEVKWQKVSESKVEFYLALVNYFFATRFLRFRALVVPDKSHLRHGEFCQDHDSFYYKMYFTMLKVWISPSLRYRVYVDIKDSRGSEKVRDLRNVLCNNMYDFDRQIIEHIQVVRSHEIQQIQLADLLIGAIGYANRNLVGNKGKLQLVERIRSLSRYKLTQSTLLGEGKFNLFHWQARAEGVDDVD